MKECDVRVRKKERNKERTEKESIIRQKAKLVSLVFQYSNLHQSSPNSEVQGQIKPHLEMMWKKKRP